MNINYYELGALALTAVFFTVIWILEKKKVDFGILTLLGTGFGVVVGLVFKGHYNYVIIFGNIYTRLLTALVIPLLLFSIISSITNLGDSVHVKKIGIKSILFLLLNTFAASIITLFTALFFKLGQGFQYGTVSAYEAKEIPAFMDTILSMFPENLMAHWGNGEVVPVLIFAIIIAVSYNRSVTSSDRLKPFKAFIDAGNEVLGQAVSWLIGFTPYAVLTLIARAVGRSELADFLPLLGVLVLAYALSIVQIFGVESLLLRGIGKLNPIPFLKGIAPAGIVAFTSQSSIGTIPVTIRQLTKKLGVDEDAAAFTAGLGANLGMPGCAGIWPVLLAVFTVQVLELAYGPLQYAFLILMAIVVSIGTVGVPGTATVAATALFSAAGLPVEMIVLFAPISTIADMARTATNVVGAATAAVLAAETEGLLDKEKYYGVSDRGTKKDLKQES